LLAEGWQGGAPEARDALREAYASSLLYGEHTWGGAYWWIYGKYEAKYGEAWQAERRAGRFNRIESSWAEHTAYIERAAQRSSEVLVAQLSSLAAGVSAAGPRVVVFNPLAWKRSGRVTLQPPAETPRWRGLKPADGQGETVAVAWDDQGGVSFLAPDIPATGYRTFVPAEPTAARARVGYEPATGTLESPRFRARLDTNQMVLRSLVDLATGREWVDPSATPGFGQFLYERFSADQVGSFVKAYVKIDADWATNELGKPMLPSAQQVPYLRVSPSGFTTTYRVEADRVTVQGVARGVTGLRGDLRVTFTLPAAEPCLDVEVSLEKPAEPLPEAGWLAFPFRLEAPRFRLGRQGSVVDPAADLVPGSNRHLFAITTGLTVTDPAGHGVGLCPRDHGFVSLGQPGAWQFSMDDFSREPAVYVQLFNNQWTTNFRLWNEGRWTSRVRLWAVEPGMGLERSLVDPSLESRYPMVATICGAPAGTLPTTAAGLELSRTGVQVTTTRPNAEGSVVHVRLWELVGKAGACRVRLPSAWRNAEVEPVDLRGRSLGPRRAVEHGAMEVALEAYAPATLRVTLPVASVRAEAGKTP
ncbi:MAG: hypothetical protein IT580_03810, partial [Verrucomicrobiales bacterium]|nr:hypothetical protein [Verrucomicrobiales bacterium]